MGFPREINLQCFCNNTIHIQRTIPHNLTRPAKVRKYIPTAAKDLLYLFLSFHNMDKNHIMIFIFSTSIEIKDT